MITELAVVSRLEPEAVWVKTRRNSACGTCKVKAGCGQEVLQRLGQNWTELEIRLPEHFRAKLTLGDTVEIGIDERAVLVASLLAYGVPLIGLLLGVVAASGTESRLLGVLAAAAGLYLGALVVQRWVRGQCSAAYEPVVIGVRSIAAQPLGESGTSFSADAPAGQIR